MSMSDIMRQFHQKPDRQAKYVVKFEAKVSKIELNDDFNDSSQQDFS